MADLVTVGDALAGRGYAAARHVGREVLLGEENKIRELPSGFLRADGSLDLYDDVKKLFRPVFQNGRPAIQCTGWVGYIPLNDRFALEVTPKVPIRNLERLVGMAAGYSPQILQKYTRHFATTTERPESIFLLLCDQLLDSFDRIWDAGLLKAYNRVERIGSSPSGRVDPYASAWRTAKAGKPTAVSSSFQRTVDFGQNRMLLFAFEKLFARYLGDANQSMHHRIGRLERAIDRLQDVQSARPHEIAPGAIAGYLSNLPAHQEHYADALLVAQLILNDVGLSIRDGNGTTILPSILIDMAKVFEAYVQRVLAERLEVDGRIAVKDGNPGPPLGVATKLFEPFHVVGKANPDMTPDIVIEVDGVTRLVIDAKYKGARKLPDREDTEQAIAYGARYGCNRVMLLHAARQPTQPSVQHIGNVGTFSVYNGLIDLLAHPIQDEETKLADAVRALL
ncbi:restriction endonuclease [Devosia sp. MC521]|uniref:McrC family protein n=1 Tax=Devosia sp. MC521 TaxID=2759954 RepID=UPI0015FDE630|nr:restriction endonuclease [Devosia sp. MC521]MBJ6986059.1 restriction endonuclease [Devosia sp. MC521]QMW61429.1 restriction endonuclease [Devosia sp. MC521]